MARNYRYISGDSHLEIDAKWWVDRVPKQYRDQAPRLVRLPDGSDAWAIEGQPLRQVPFDLYGGKGRDVWKPCGQNYATTPGTGPAEQRLKEAYENYRRLEQKKTQVGGMPAIEYHYRGRAEEHDWSGSLVVIARGKDIFTVLGVTYADSDLIQIQENVIARAIASLDFSAH